MRTDLDRLRVDFCDRASDHPSRLRVKTYRVAHCELLSNLLSVECALHFDCFHDLVDLIVRHVADCRDCCLNVIHISYFFRSEVVFFRREEIKPFFRKRELQKKSLDFSSSSSSSSYKRALI